MKRRTVKSRVFNHDMGWYEEVEKEVKGFLFTDEDRIMIVREYLESGCSSQRILEKYELSNRQVLFNWMDKYLNQEDCLSLPVSEESAMTQELESNKGKSKDEEIIRLKKALELEKLRSQAYKTMVDLAEKEFNIPIRKKSGTKQ